MRIVNETRLSTPLIKKIMRAAGVLRESEKTLTIKLDKRYSTRAGLFTAYDNEPRYIIHLRDEWDIITLGHEVRHLAQYQRPKYWNSTTSDEKEIDAEGFESWLEQASNIL